MTFYYISLLLYVLLYFTFLNFPIFHIWTLSSTSCSKKIYSILVSADDIRRLKICILSYAIALLRISISRTTAMTRSKSEKVDVYLLESAGEGGFRVSGEQHSLGDGDLSRLVTGSKCRPAGPWCPAASVLLILWSWLPCMAPCPPPATPSTGMPFSERNSSRSTYYQQKSEMLFPRRLLGAFSRFEGFILYFWVN